MSRDTAALDPARVAGARLAGVSLFAAASGFVVAFVLLAGMFDYPDILDRSAGQVLPQLLALGPTGRAIWACYAALPLLLIPAAAGLSTVHATPTHQTAVRLASALAFTSALCMTAGLIRWPSVQWELARSWTAASPDQQRVLATVFDGLNSMLGRFVGEFLGELAMNSAFVLFSGVAWHDRLLPRWVSGLGLVAGTVGLIAMWRNVTTAVSVIADFDNALLPVWLVIWSIALLRVRITRP